jgi:hypothetical protein
LSSIIISYLWRFFIYVCIICMELAIEDYRLSLT